MAQAITSQPRFPSLVEQVVTHVRPDTDALICLWLVKKFVRQARDAQIVLAERSRIEALRDPNTIFVDIGGGPFDQHGQRFGRASSAVLVANGLGMQNDPRIAALLELAAKADNRNWIPPTDIHHVIYGLRGKLQRDGQTDWSTLINMAFMYFDIIFEQESKRIRARDRLAQNPSLIRRLPNDLYVAILIGERGLVDAAYERGVDVTVGTNVVDGGFYTGIQVNPDRQGLELTRVVEALRQAEAQHRGIDVTGENLAYMLADGPIKVWFVLDNFRLILNGSGTWELKEDEFTLLKPIQIANLVCRVLGRIPPSLVERWKSQ